jgi:hypothetical protein
MHMSTERASVPIQRASSDVNSTRITDEIPEVDQECVAFTQPDEMLTKSRCRVCASLGSTVRAFTDFDENMLFVVDEAWVSVLWSTM